MTTPDASLRSAIRPFSHAGICTLVFACVLTGCAPPGQRIFNPDAGKPPRPYTPPSPPAKPAPAPFIQIVAGTPHDAWAPTVTVAAKRALARKPNVLFLITALSPQTSSPAAQADALTQLTQLEAEEIGAVIVAAGARTGQIQIEARTDEHAASPRVTVNLR